MSQNLYAEIAIPLAAPGTFTYRIPDELVEHVKKGCRVEIQFGKRKLYAGLVLDAEVLEQPDFSPKDILSVLDANPIIGNETIDFYKWISSYYACTIGEVLFAALPSVLKLASEALVIRNEDIVADETFHNDDEFLILEALEFNQELSISDLQGILQKKTVLPVLHKMLSKGLIYLREDAKQRYKPKTVNILVWGDDYQDDPSRNLAFEAVESIEKQSLVLLAFLQLSYSLPYVTYSNILKKTKVTRGVIDGLVKKQILKKKGLELSRLGDLQYEANRDLPPLEQQQIEAIDSLNLQFKEKEICLLHGVTGSGKTRVFIEMIRAVIKQGKQVLYLLPEIALTSTFIKRLEKVFGSSVIPYHSKLNEQERGEVFLRASNDIPIIVGARSSTLLPFKNLGLIIVDESHDASYKQHDPAPRYNARDACMMLASFHRAKVILGTATPSIESFHAHQTGRYGYFHMSKRVFDLKPPEIVIHPITDQMKFILKGALSPDLISKITETLDNNQQCLIFRNRRGYAPVSKCKTCGHVHPCKNCDISMTFHKYSKQLKCHYCGHKERLIAMCSSCGNNTMELRGEGTEKIVETLQDLFPLADVDRMDMETASGKTKLAAILQRFESGQTDILVGTQMITKGLDFENVGLVGVVSVDSMLHFPDFRAEERTFQMLSQVAGRAGRRSNKSLVFIQTYQPQHPVIQAVKNRDFSGFYERIVQERNQFYYPPFVRFIEVQIRSVDPNIAQEKSFELANHLKKISWVVILGPTANPIPRIKNRFIFNIVVKHGRSNKVRVNTKNAIRTIVEKMNESKMLKRTQVKLNVDPY